jgi:hypothetical protein
LCKHFKKRFFQFEENEKKKWPGEALHMLIIVTERSLVRCPNQAPKYISLQSATQDYFQNNAG